MSVIAVESTKPPGVAHVVLGLQVGGLERVVVNLAGGLRERFRPIVVCLEGGGAFQQELEKLGIPVHVLGKKNGVDWNAVKKLASICRQERVEIVHTHNPAAHFHGVMAAVRANVPVRVHTKHGRNHTTDRKKVWANRIASWFTDVIVPVSDDTRDVVLQIERVRPTKVRRIWNGVDTDLYRDTSRAGDRGPVIGTVARLSPEKDQRTMLAAFRLVLGEIPEARLVIAGDGPCAADLKAFAHQLGISRSVEFLGLRNDVPALLDKFAVFTLSSRTEGLSMTVLEAMSAGSPVVATDVGGNREIVSPPECGLIVPPHDPKALADGYLTLLRDPVRRTQLGEAGRARAAAQFSLREMVQRYGEIYQEFLARKCGHLTEGPGD
jgi:sugar transferase (PEP-CTERM/EpsH1 system associated)